VVAYAYDIAYHHWLPTPTLTVLCKRETVFWSNACPYVILTCDTDGIVINSVGNIQL